VMEVGGEAGSSGCRCIHSWKSGVVSRKVDRTVEGGGGVRTCGSAAGSGVDARKGLGIVMAAENRNRCGMYFPSLLKSCLIKNRPTRLYFSAEAPKAVLPES
jgi:hypothetical protein